MVKKMKVIKENIPAEINNREIFNTNQLAIFLSVPKHQIYRWTNTGALPRPHKLAHKTNYWFKQEIIDWIASH